VNLRSNFIAIFAAVVTLFPPGARAVDPVVTTIAVRILKDPQIIGRTLNEIPMEMPNVVTKTMGGHTFWDTKDRSRGWKLQCNKLAGNCRILDPDDYRFAWGGKDAMKKTFAALKANGMVFYRPIGLPDIQATMGGKVFWTNLAERDGWKVQRNDFSGHCRILDPQDARIAWGRCDDLAAIFGEGASE
jgi:hypothetical protein